MAMIKCSECGNSVSTTAEHCPHCGAKPKAKSGVSVTGKLIISLIVMIGILANIGNREQQRTASTESALSEVAVSRKAEAAQSNSSSGATSNTNDKSVLLALTESNERDESKPIPTYTAKEIAAAYQHNTVAADRKYKDQFFKVVGAVAAIDTSLFNEIVITMKGGINPFMEPQFRLSKDHADFAADLNPGARISLICRGRGDIAKIPMADKCTPASQSFQN